MKARLARRNLSVAAISAGLVGVMTVAALAAWTTSASGIGASASGSLTAPGTPSASGVTSSNVTLTWTAGTAGSATVKYHVERAPFGTSTWSDVCSSTDAAPINGLTCNDTTVAAATDYQYRVTSEAGKWRQTGGTSAKVTTPAGGATQLVFTTQPGGGTGGSAWPTQPVVTLKDASNNTVNSTATVTLTIGTNAGPGGTLTCTGGNSVAAVAGVATFSGCKIDKTGNGYTLVATTTSPSLTRTSSTFNITAGTASQLLFTTQPSASNTASTPFGTQPTVSVTDAGGNVVASVASITLAIGTNPSGGVLTCTTNPKQASAGVDTFVGCKIDKPGTGYTLTASGGGLNPATSTAFDVVTGPATQLVFTTQPSTTTSMINMSPQPVVTIEDANGNTVNSTATVALAIGTNPGSGTLSCTSNSVAAVAGVATFAGCDIDKAGTGYTLVATTTSPSLTKTSTTFNITVGAATQLEFTAQPSSSTGGTAFITAQQPVVKVEDAGGNVVTSNTASITLAIGTNPSSGTLTCTANPKAAVAGVATFAGCKIDKAGTGYTLIATSSGLTSDTTSAFNITVGAAAQLEFTTQPGNATAANTNLSTQPVVKVEDAGGNVVTGSSASITLAIANNSGGGTLSCTTNPLAATSGVASFAGCKISAAGGAYTLKATSGTLTLDTSSPFAVGFAATAIVVADGGGTPNLPEIGDTISVTFSQPVKTTSVCSTWTTGTLTGISVKMNRGNGGGTNDLTITGCSNSLNFASGNITTPSSQWIGGNNTATWGSSTMVYLSGSNTIQITLGGAPGFTPATGTASTTYTYTPDAAIQNSSGTAVVGSTATTSTAIQF